MKRSMFLELLDEERSIPKGGPRKFRTAQELFDMLDARKLLMSKAEASRDKGELTSEQCEQLIALIRKNIGLTQ